MEPKHAITYTKPLCDVHPGQLIVGPGGHRSRLTYSRRVRRGVHEVRLMSVDTGVETSGEFPSSFQVRCVEFERSARAS